ncbi:hypothetical protein NDU88_006933 [Pleurodeles waltl]|uniref:Secreted protein n=1 Tax=Pleurodeles waltl TaxID=8319 RepID=A0AAV7PSP5_PLEWA|nr:hypothetical protein NDU88_006933 [Pleurodeles waltl]
MHSHGWPVAALAAATVCSLRHKYEERLTELDGVAHCEYIIYKMIVKLNFFYKIRSPFPGKLEGACRMNKITHNQTVANMAALPPPR